ncbi:MAG: hypothetical protein ND866_24595 [Pyrinomonadaceae bacterium]|nr:hypothetical protein [Pyrinomonadaceae bacterium]
MNIRTDIRPGDIGYLIYLHGIVAFTDRKYKEYGVIFIRLIVGFISSMVRRTMSSAMG